MPRHRGSPPQSALLDGGRSRRYGRMQRNLGSCALQLEIGAGRSRPLRTLVAPHSSNPLRRRDEVVPVASSPITVPRRHGRIARHAPRALPSRSIQPREATRAALEPRVSDRALGVACLVACPAISGLFLGLIAVVGAYPTGGGHAVALGSLVGAVAFVANMVAICLTASATRVRAGRRARAGLR